MTKTKLTAMQVAKLQPRAAAYLVWDALQPGLAVRVQPSGRRTFVCVYSHHGRVRWYTIGQVDLAQARQIANDVKHQVALDKDPAAERRAKRGAGTFEELATRYVEEHAKRENKSWKQAASLVRRCLLPKWGKLKAADVTRADVKALKASIAAPVTANQVLKSASAIFAWAIREEFGGVAVNPCSLVEHNKTASRERVLSDSEIPRLWAALDAAGLVRATALKTILLVGQRPGEVCHMHRAHIKDGWWEMPGAPEAATGWPGTKNSRDHRIWLAAPVQALLAELDDGSGGPVFRGAWGLAAAMRAACAEIGIPRATPHDLRRTHGTTVAVLGFGTDVMNRVQNHKEGGIGGVYNRYSYAKEVQHAMEATAAHLLALAEGRAQASNVVAFTAAK